jgi:hypothetical protein
MQEVHCLPMNVWQAKCLQYQQQGREHYQSCKYPQANLWRLFYKDEAKQLREDVK